MTESAPPSSDRPFAVCRRGHRTETIVLTLCSILTGLLIRWRCEICGEEWLTR
jgi:hypothetical protein